MNSTTGRKIEADQNSLPAAQASTAAEVIQQFIDELQRRAPAAGIREPADSLTLAEAALRLGRAAPQGEATPDIAALLFTAASNISMLQPFLQLE